MADSVALIRAQVRGDETTAFRLGLDIATAIVEAANAAREARSA